MKKHRKNKNRMPLHQVMLSTVVWMASFSGSASWSQSTDPEATDPAAAESKPLVARAERKGLEEVIVTAQRREQNVQEVAISISVFSQEQLSNANMTNASDLAIYTPSLTTNTRFGNEMTTFAIRGFTQDLRTTASVATYFAEVVAPRGQSSQTSGDGAGPGYFFDLQNVQVLKGPQGTLFGRNTTGGAVLLVPNKPADEFEGFVEYSRGDFGLRQNQAVVNIPVSDRFRMRFGIDDKKSDGHLNNFARVGADRLGNVNYTAARLSFTFDVTDNFENYTILNYVDSDTHGYTSALFACNENPDEAFELIVSLLTLPGCQQQLADQAAAGRDGHYDLISTVATPITTIEEKRFINTATWHLGDDITLKNILAYAHLESENGSDIFGTRFPEITGTALQPILDLLPVGTPTVGAVYDPRREFAVGVSVPAPGIPVTSQQTWVAELQVQGSSLESRLQWQGGIYYENSEPDGFSGNNSAGVISCELATIEGEPSDYNCFDPTAGQLGGVIRGRLKTEYLNKAVYAQASYDILDSLSTTLGLRYTWDETKGYGIKERYTFVGTVQQAPIITVDTPKTESEAPTGLLEFSYRPLDNVMSYVKYIRGYRQGTVNLASDPGVNTHEPETVDTYEIGAKTSFGGWFPGVFNIAVFDNDFTDMQLQAGYVSPNSGPTTAIFNAGRSEIKGFEAELNLQLTEGLLASVSYSKLDTKLIEQDNNQAEVEAAAGPFAGFSYTPIADTGDELPFAPEESYIASLIYQLPLPQSIGAVDVAVTYVYTSEQRATGSSASPFDVIDEYSLWNYNLSWSDILGMPLDLSLFVTNARDEEYVTYLSGTYNALGFDSRMVGLPKMYGARLKYHFGAYAN